jgi:threonine synthase
MQEQRTAYDRSLPDDGGVAYTVTCVRCKSEAETDSYQTECAICHGALEFHYADPIEGAHRTRKSMWKYGELLPVRNDGDIISLGEGNTPLVRSRLYRDRKVYLKNETANPTGSHKDRALSIGITKAIEFGFDTCMLYSDGSTALSSAAYAARAGIRNIAITPANAPDSRLLPLMVYNSIVLEYQGAAADALSWVHETCGAAGIYETSTYRRANPYESEGAKTISYEIIEDLGSVPDCIIVPVGGGGTLSGIWRGFVDLKRRGRTDRLPRLVGVLPAGYRLLEVGLEEGATTEEDLKALATFAVPTTLQAKLAMSLPPDGIEAIAAIRDSGGCFLFASDQEALRSQQRLGAREGIYAEISAAVSIVALDRLIANSFIRRDEIAVALISGSGFRETGELGSLVPLKKTLVGPATGVAELTSLFEQLRPVERR